LATPKPPNAYTPLGLSQEDAAAYVGIGKTTFGVMVEDGRMPHPRKVGRRRVWDSEEVRSAFKNLPVDGGNQTDNPWDKESTL
jgi:excisionase family DNA binding protein